MSAAMMDEYQRQRYESQSQQLRLELKTWESEWAKSHDGKKPGRADIKQNPDIARTYKKYNNTRDILAGKIDPPADGTDKPRKRKQTEAPLATPSKRSKFAETPSKSQTYPLYVSTPSTARKLFSPVPPTSIGPTPQRDGRVLGLFDLLPKNGIAETPSRSTNKAKPVTSAAIQATPTKRTALYGDSGSTAKFKRTPTSSSKRRMLDGFMTPLKNRSGNVHGEKSPAVKSGNQFATPSFLRRAPLPPLDENGEFLSPKPLNLPRKPLVRGLSSVVASLRKLEEEQLDDDLEVLHEMENEAAHGPPKQRKQNKHEEEILAADSQAQNLPLGGFDDEARYDSAPEEGLDRGGRPLRVYKKKGQKRTTRKVNMKPVWNPRSAQTAEEEGPMPNDDAGTDGLQPSAEGDGVEHSGSEFEDPGGEEEPKQGGKAPKKGTKAKEGTIKKAVRKVNELAHANFRRLKLRNNGAKGGPGYNSKFRRRR